MPGPITLAVEVTHISKNGFWLLLGDEELLVPFDQFPWFKKATLEHLKQSTIWPDHPQQSSTIKWGIFSMKKPRNSSCGALVFEDQASAFFTRSATKG